jgi:dihydrodipicolinate synthase/N-acetylneuraminate lyase
MGERPAVSHLRGRRLPGFTTGSGCVAPALSAGILAAAQAGDWTTAEALRRQFLPLEDLRDEWGPARVLHASVEAAGLARVGPIPPFVSELSGDQRASVATVATALADAARSVSRA